MPYPNPNNNDPDPSSTDHPTSYERAKVKRIGGGYNYKYEGPSNERHTE